MADHCGNGDPTGRKHPPEIEMAAFDALPRAIRRAIDGANRNFSALSALEQLNGPCSGDQAALIAAVERQDWR